MHHIHREHLEPYRPIASIFKNHLTGSMSLGMPLTSLNKLVHVGQDLFISCFAKSPGLCTVPTEISFETSQSDQGHRATRKADN